MEAYVLAAIIVAIVQIIIIVKFFQIAQDLRFFRGEYEKLKRTHRFGEYVNTKGDKAFAVGDQVYSLELKRKVDIQSIREDGSYRCTYLTNAGMCRKDIPGDQLTDTPPTEAK
ncbi:hypothetical protein HQ36_02005 [Porphyromonas gingivicanis]|uniref:Uncharacterized protein n=1 Tax=Porphyromonas gingivicanis TaxID=266762 RepID=A0A0A2G5C6_9PORP|nr:hypothetical protein [Porphyromonas gingivicanis]KGN98411.1 hypothetical protein HQ36_02005 [Porphyromonas gingivicanis]